jgi:hypothetical protein
MPKIRYVARKFSEASQVEEEKEHRRLLGVVSEQWDELTGDL